MTRPMTSLRNRLALLVFAIALGAMGIVYLGVVPTLESSLRDEALRNLAGDARRWSPPIARAIDRSAPAGRIDDLVRDAADRSSARVTLLGVNRTGPDTFLKSDSTREVEIRDLQFGVAVDTATSGRAAVATEAGAQGRVGEAALPLFSRD